MKNNNKTKTMSLTKEQVSNLEVIFALARQSVVNSEDQLIGVINFKKDLYKTLDIKAEKVEEKTKEQTEDKAEPVSND